MFANPVLEISFDFRDALQRSDAACGADNFGWFSVRAPICNVFRDSTRKKVWFLGYNVESATPQG